MLKQLLLLSEEIQERCRFVQFEAEQRPSRLRILTELGKIINRRSWEEVVFFGFEEPLKTRFALIDH